MIFFCTCTTHTHTHTHTQFSGANPEKLVVKTRHFLDSKGTYSPGKGRRCEGKEGEIEEGRVRQTSQFSQCNCETHGNLISI